MLLAVNVQAMIQQAAWTGWRAAAGVWRSSHGKRLALLAAFHTEVVALVRLDAASSNLSSTHHLTRQCHHLLCKVAPPCTFLKIGGTGLPSWRWV